MVDEVVQAGVDFGRVGFGQPAAKIWNGTQFFEGVIKLGTVEGAGLGCEGALFDLLDLGIDAGLAFGVAGEIPLACEVGVFEAGELKFKSFELLAFSF